jgi:hypothetical protein
MFSENKITAKLKVYAAIYSYNGLRRSFLLRLREDCQDKKKKVKEACNI